MHGRIFTFKMGTDYPIFFGWYKDGKKHGRETEINCSSGYYQRYYKNGEKDGT